MDKFIDSTALFSNGVFSTFPESVNPTGLLSWGIFWNTEKATRILPKVYTGIAKVERVAATSAVDRIATSKW